MFTGFSWGRGDELAVYHATRGLDNNPVALQSGQETLKTVSWDNVHSAMQPLIAEGFSAFRSLLDIRSKSEISLQDESKSFAQGLSAEEEKAAIADVSLRLRRSFDQILYNMNMCVGEDHELRSYLSNLKLASATWHLIDILLLQDNDAPCNEMVDWVYTHFPRNNAPEETQELVNDAEVNGSESTSFWDIVHGFMLRGDLPSAWAVLSLDLRYVAAQSNHASGVATASDEEVLHLFHNLRVLMLEMPRREGPLPQQQLKLSDEDEAAWQAAAFDCSDREFVSHWTEWRRAVSQLRHKNKSLLKNLDEAKNGSQLATVLAVLDGDIATIERLLQDDTWLHKLAANLLFVSPNQRKDEMEGIVAQLIQHSRETSRVEISESVQHLLETVFASKVAVTLQLLHEVVGDRWVTAHLAQILAQSGALQSASSGADEFMLGDHEMDMREWFLVEYAVQLGLGGYQSKRNAHSPASWRIAVKYLSTLDREVVLAQSLPGPATAVTLGYLYIEMITDRLDIVSDRHCSSVTRTCKAMNIPCEKLINQRVMYWWCQNGGRQKFVQDKLPSTLKGVSNALLWATKSEQGPSNLLRLISQSSNIDTLDILVESINPELMQPTKEFPSEALRFLSEYARLHQNLSEASEMLRASDEAYNFVTLEECFMLRDKALGQLCTIITLNLAPKQFLIPMLRKVLLWEMTGASSKGDIQEVVSSRPPIMTMAQASQLQGCLEDPAHEAQVGAPQSEALEADKSIMRIVLAQSLARAVLTAQN
mmetsp:Transcript_3319/g.6329  ORF Transcript_3319/g.6329 Transcript_3319/m.6329 type:complete len:765 (+) Transcript_3319:143-2437(+)